MIQITKALSIRQPWAALIYGGVKPVENRTWSTNFRGWFAIHAGKKFDMEGQKIIVDMIGENPYEKPLSPIEYPRGGIVGVAKLVDCVTEMDSPWFCGPYGFVIEDARPITFIPCKGRLGFFDISELIKPVNLGVKL